MAILGKIRRLLGLGRRKNKRMPSMYVSSLDLTKECMVISNSANEKIASIDLKDCDTIICFNNYDIPLRRLSKSCPDIHSNRIVEMGKYMVEIRNLYHRR
ncbi:hypothetical protein [Turkeypox virus]|uniref:Uncharacterized protein n=1 Tax=Turkeypox virus TaxID=336486 RepID=A0A0M5HS74_9POXV|nr:hypothetical protein ASN15_gp077 [Turkeypox virus]ALA62451.1 hypothetical protein [Turkeypox virus]